MKTSKNPLYVLGYTCLSLGITCLFISFITFIRNSFQLSSVTNSTGIMGIVWFLIGLCVYIPVNYRKTKHERLIKEGVCYDAEIVRLLPNVHIQIGNNVSVYAECSYINQEGKTHTVKSGLFSLHYPFGLRMNGIGMARYGYQNMLRDYVSRYDKESIRAKVYVSRKDPEDCFVEIGYKLENNKNT